MTALYWFIIYYCSTAVGEHGPARMPLKPIGISPGTSPADKMPQHYYEANQVVANRLRQWSGRLESGKMICDCLYAFIDELLQGLDWRSICDSCAKLFALACLSDRGKRDVNNHWNRMLQHKEGLSSHWRNERRITFWRVTRVYIEKNSLTSKTGLSELSSILPSFHKSSCVSIFTSSWPQYSR